MRTIKRIYNKILITYKQKEFILDTVEFILLQLIDLPFPYNLILLIIPMIARIIIYLING